MNDLKSNTMERVKYIAYVINCDGLYTISLKGKGGPIISDKSLDKAKEKFNEALLLSISVSNLVTYNITEWKILDSIEYKNLKLISKRNKDMKNSIVKIKRKHKR